MTLVCKHVSLNTQKKILIKVTFCTDDYHNKDPLGFKYVVGILAIIL